MLVFLYGSDSYRLNQCKNELIARHKSKYPSGMNVFSFDFSDDGDIDRWEDVIKSMSFFNEHKLIVCSNVFFKKVIADRIFGRIKDLGLAVAGDLTLLVKDNLPESELQIKHRDLFRVLKEKSSLSKSIEPLRGVDLSNWAREELRARDCAIKNSALNKLIDLAGNDSQALINEISKLSAYRRGEIQDGDVELLVNKSGELSIFDLIEAVSSGDKKRAFELLYRELKNGRDPYYILTMIVYQFRNLLAVKDLQKRGYSPAEIARKLKLHHFVVAKSFKSRLALKDGLAIYNNLLVLDNGLKAGKLDIEDSLCRITIC